MTKRKVTVVTTGNASDKRQHPRYELPVIRVLVKDKEYDLVDVSSEGVFVAGVEGTWPDGAPIEMTLKVPLMNKVSPMVIEGVVIRQSARGLAIHYGTPNRTWPQVLRVLDIKTK
ncbi:MAG: PilZ domain-containing protein [Magnetospirillum sp. WYHS-4]